MRWLPTIGLNVKACSLVYSDISHKISRTSASFRLALSVPRSSQLCSCKISRVRWLKEVNPRRMLDSRPDSTNFGLFGDGPEAKYQSRFMRERYRGPGRTGVCPANARVDGIASGGVQLFCDSTPLARRMLDKHPKPFLSFTTNALESTGLRNGPHLVFL